MARIAFSISNRQSIMARHLLCGLVLLTCFHSANCGQSAHALHSTKRVNSSARSEWTAKDGWNGLVVGKHTMKDVEAKLGKVQKTEVLAGDTCYLYKDGDISFSVDEDTKKINMIRLRGNLKDANLMPTSIPAAMKIYGKLGVVSYNKASGKTYGKPGLTVQADSSSDPEKIVWMEFSTP